MKESKILGKITNIFSIQSIREELGIGRTNFEELGREFEQIRDSIEDMENQVMDRTKVASLRADLSVYRMEQAEISQQEELAEQQRLLEEQEHLEVIEKENEIRDLSTLLVRNDAICVHMFGDGLLDKGKKRTMKFGKRDLETKMNVLVGLGPELYTSTIRNGNDGDRTFQEKSNPVGFILGGGRVETANQDDAQTTLEGGKRVSQYDRDEKSLDDLEDQIDGAVNNDHDSYNELAISQPEIRGMFISPYSMIDFEGVIKFDTNIQDMIYRAVAKAKDLALPIFTQNQEGQFVALEIKDDGTVSQGEPLKTDEVIGDAFQMSDERVQQAINEVFKDSPFKLNNPEADLFDDWSETKMIAEMMMNNERVEGINARDFSPMDWGTLDEWVEYIQSVAQSSPEIESLQKSAAIRLKGIADVLRKKVIRKLM